MAHVLMLCDTFAPTLGGSEKMLLDLARGFTAIGHQVTVLTPAAPRSAPFDASEPYTIIRSSAWQKLFKAGGSPRAIVSRMARLLIVPLIFRQALAVKKVDVLIVGHVLPLGNMAAAIKRMRPRIRSIVMTYGEDVTMYARGPRMRGMLVDALNAADAITCLTNDSKQEIADLSSTLEQETAVIPPAVTQPGEPAAVTVEALRDRFSLRGRRVLLTVCRLAPRKGIDVTLRAVKQLEHDYPDLVYVIAGEGPDLPRLQQMVSELGLDSRVRFIGPVNSFGASSASDLLPDARDIYALCDLFCMPNRQMPDGEREGFGIVFLEANLAGKAVIGGRSGGAPDAVQHGETGLLVNPESADEVAEAVRTLLDDRAMAQRLGEAGRLRAEQQFSIEQFVQKYAELF